MLHLKTSVRTESLQLPLKRAMALAADLAVDGIAINARSELRPADLTRTAIRHLKKLLSDHRLKVSSVNFPTRRGYGASEDLEQRLDATKGAMQMAADLGCDHVSNSIGKIPATEHDAVLLQALTDLGIFGQRIGARLAIRSGPDEADDVMRLLDALPDASVAVEFDPAELILHRHAPSDFLRTVGEHVVHVRARDAVRDLSRGQDSVVELGRGSVDYPEVLAILEEKNYAGYLTVEPAPEKEPIEAIRQGLEFLRNLFQ